MSTKAKKKPRAERPITDRMRMFCEGIMSGFTAVAAYERAGYSARGDAADVCASKLIRIPKVAAYLETLRAQAIAKAGFTRDDLVGWLVDVIKTPVSEVGEGHRLAQKVKVDEMGMMIEMPGKLGAAKQLAEVMGWNKPQEVKVDLSEKLADIIGRVRGE